MKIKSEADNDNNITAGVIPVSNFFAHWINEIDIKKYGDDIPILLLTNTVEIYYILITLNYIHTPMKC